MPGRFKLAAGLALLQLFTAANGAYTLQDDYSGSKFFDMFSFFTDDDPTHGYVDYVSQSAAQSAGLISTNNNQVTMAVDSSNVASGRGRKSVRVTSKASYNHGLIILDLAHFPANACGAWPAFWTVGPNWPNNGEIDIIEGVNMQDHNSVALHTGPGCSIANTSPNMGSSSNAQQAFSGTVGTSNCDVAAEGQATNAGCSIASKDKSSYGNGLNSVQGGVYATEWTSDAIKVWFFPRSSIPANMDSSPDPSTWGTPMAAFQSTSCDIDSAFRDQQIVFDTTFCGDWAGNVWSSDATCSSKASTCEEYVQNNPQAFSEAYWTINSLKVFSGSGSGNSSVPVPSASRSGVPMSSWSGVPIGSSPAATASACVPPMCSPEAGWPGAPAPTQSQPDRWTAQPDAQTRTGGWGGRGRWSHGARDLTVATSTPITLPAPMRRSAESTDNKHLKRHLGEHRRHGSRFTL